MSSYRISIPQTELKTGMEYIDHVIIAPTRFHAKISPSDLVSHFITSRANYTKRRIGEKTDNVIVVKVKKKGVEPGFFAYELNEEFYNSIKSMIIAELNQIIDQIKQTRKDGIPFDPENPAQEAALKIIKKSFFSKELTTIEKIKKLRNHLEVAKTHPKNDAFFKEFFCNGLHEKCEEYLTKKFDEDRTDALKAKRRVPEKLFIKGDFTKGWLKRVTAEKENLAQTAQGRYWSEKLGKIPILGKHLFTAGLTGTQFKKLETKHVKNVDFIRETIVNNLAINFGMQGKIATIKPGVYPDGTPMLLNSQVFADDVGLIEVEKVLRGGDVNSGSCIAEKLPIKVRDSMQRLPGLQNIHFQSDNKIKGFSENLGFFLMAGDYDILGSTGGNKGIANGELYALDFGHSLEGNNSIIPSLRDDFRFKQPSKTVKNIDAFYDHPLSELMQGVYLLMKQRGKENDIPQSVIQWYQKKSEEMDGNGNKTQEALKAKSFIDRFNKITPNSDVKIWDDCIATLKAAASSNESYDLYATKVEEMKDRYIKNTERFLKKFEQRIKLNPDELNFVENLEKFLCDSRYITNTSKDGTVLLNHLRVTDYDQRVPCQMRRSGNNINLSIEPKDNKHAEILQSKLNEYCRKHKVTIYLNFDPKSNTLNMGCSAQNLPSLMKAFKETNVAEHHEKLIAESPAVQRALNLQRLQPQDLRILPSEAKKRAEAKEQEKKQNSAKVQNLSEAQKLAEDKFKNLLGKLEKRLKEQLKVYRTAAQKSSDPNQYFDKIYALKMALRRLEILTKGELKDAPLSMRIGALERHMAFLKRDTKDLQSSRSIKRLFDMDSQATKIANNYLKQINNEYNPLKTLYQYRQQRIRELTGDEPPPSPQSRKPSVP